MAPGAGSASRAMYLARVVHCQQSMFLTLRSEGFAMVENAVKLDALPTGLEFPAELASRIYFDAAAHRLVYRGFMYKSHYDRLIRLDSSVEYRRAVQRLFQCSSDMETPHLRRFGRIIAILIAVCLLLAGVIWWQLMSPVRGSSPSSPRIAPQDVDSGAASHPTESCQ